MASTKLASTASDVVRQRPKSSLKVYSDKMPGVKNMKVGETGTFLVTATVKSIYSGDSAYYDEYSDNDDKMLCATLQVTDVKEE